MSRQHRANDEQSLRLTQAAVAALQRQPELIDRVLSTLDHWDRIAPADSKPLRDEWRRVIALGEWHRVLSHDGTGQQLRQASPLGKALSPQQRLQIIRACRNRNSNI